MADYPHHARPDSLEADGQAEFVTRGLPETVGAVLHQVDRWLIAHPGAAGRLGAAAGELVGSYLGAKRHNACEPGTGVAAS